MILVALLTSGEELPASVSEARLNRQGFRVHVTESACQMGQTKIRVLLPDRLEPEHRYSVVYVLPVEAGDASQYGDGLLEVKHCDLHNKYRAVFVSPTFSHVPWYADHPTDRRMHQETYFLKVVVPFVEQQYPVEAKPSGRFLLGFSKSGWGAFSLLLRHPDLFARAVAWDAPLMKDKPDQFGMDDIFGTQENFDMYQITRLLEQRATEFRTGNRLILTGYGNFREHHRQVHDLMTRLGILHEYRDGPERKHDWHSGWVEEAAALLFDGP